MRIGKVAHDAGVNIQTLRYYERRGLLPDTERLASGYREYDPAIVSLVRFIRNAQELGFTLREIGELIELRANRGRTKPEVRELANTKVEEIDRRIHRLGYIKNELTALVEKCKTASPDTDCVIIGAMDKANVQGCRADQRNST